MPAPVQQYFPGFPPNVDPAVRKMIQHLYDRVNFLVGQVEGLTPVSQIEQRVRRAEVALQAVQDSQTTLPTFVGFPGNQLISGDAVIGGTTIGLTFTGPSSSISITVTSAATFRTATGTAQSGSNSDITFLNVLQGIVLLDTTPAQITADQNDYNPGTGSSFRLSTDAVWTITGFANGTDGRIIMFCNVGAFDLILAHQSLSSTAANRIITGIAADVTYPPNCCGIIKYDTTDDRWRVVI